MEKTGEAMESIEQSIKLLSPSFHDGDQKN